MATLILKQS